MRIVPGCSIMKVRFVPSLGASKPIGAFSPVTKLVSPSMGGGMNCCPGLEFVLEFPPQPKSRAAPASTTAKPADIRTHPLMALQLRRGYHGAEGAQASSPRRARGVNQFPLGRPFLRFVRGWGRVNLLSRPQRRERGRLVSCSLLVPGFVCGVGDTRTKLVILPNPSHEQGATAWTAKRAHV